MFIRFFIIFLFSMENVGERQYVRVFDGANDMECLLSNTTEG